MVLKGQRHESLDKLGLAALTANMMNEATQDSTNEELAAHATVLVMCPQAGTTMWLFSATC